ncbi:hypothetical protein [Arthrospiribacter ruber]|uniref:Uncharacterized protein n=1 Tax=Arthrospiribacter ruber TaxID=2487934 RepID=A0A951IV30_9BACT|nr:hypothetical protein [Arthrospiribacter ruber]MBW3466531.1 hypothetical protein [Arthrospiribacter ruber]
MKSFLIFISLILLSHWGKCQEYKSSFEVEVDRYSENYSVYQTGSKITGIWSIRKRTIGNNREAEFFILNQNLEPEFQGEFSLPDHQDLQWADVSGEKLVLLTHYTLKTIQSFIDQLSLVSIDANSSQLSIIPFQSADLSEIVDFHTFTNHSLILARNSAGLVLQAVDHHLPENTRRKMIFDNSYEILSANKSEKDKSLTILARKKDYNQKDILYSVSVSEEGELLEKADFDLLQDKRVNYRNALFIRQGDDRIYSGVFGPRNNEHSSGIMNASINEFEEYSLNEYFFNELPDFYKGVDTSSPMHRKKRMDRRVKIGRVPVLNETFQLWDLRSSASGTWHHFEQFTSRFKYETDYQRTYIKSFSQRNRFFGNNRFARELPQIAGGYKTGNRPFRPMSEFTPYAAHLIELDENQQVKHHYRVPLAAELQFLPMPSGTFFQNEDKVLYAFYDGKTIRSSYFEKGITRFLNSTIPFDHDQKNVESSSIKTFFTEEGALLVTGKGRLTNNDGNRRTVFFVEKYVF